MRPSPRPEGAWFGKQTRDGAGGCRQAQRVRQGALSSPFKNMAGHTQGTRRALRPAWGLKSARNHWAGWWSASHTLRGIEAGFQVTWVGRGGHHPSAGRAGAEGSEQGWAAGARDSERTPQPPLGLSLQRGPAPGEENAKSPSHFQVLVSRALRAGVGVASTRVCACVCA